jgi:hypothetical protein
MTSAIRILTRHDLAFRGKNAGKYPDIFETLEINTSAMLNLPPLPLAKANANGTAYLINPLAASCKPAFNR